MSKIHKLVYVADSEIHGKGLFARQHISEGEVIGVASGKTTTTDGPHVLWLDENRGFHVNCNLRYINHSDNPNACYFDTLEVIAIRDINQDEEITHNYQCQIIE